MIPGTLEGMKSIECGIKYESKGKSSESNIFMIDVNFIRHLFEERGEGSVKVWWLNTCVPIS